MLDNSKWRHAFWMKGLNDFVTAGHDVVEMGETFQWIICKGNEIFNRMIQHTCLRLFEIDIVSLVRLFSRRVLGNEKS